MSQTQERGRVDKYYKAVREEKENNRMREKEKKKGVRVRIEELSYKVARFLQTSQKSESILLTRK